MTRLDSLKSQAVQAIFDAKQENISQETADEIIKGVNDEVSMIIECGRLLNNLKKGS